MKAQKKNVFSALFSILMLIASTIGQVALYVIPLAVIAPAVEAANGVGEVTFFDIDNSGLPGADIQKGVQTVNTQKEHVYRIHNNDGGSPDCIDEIMITYPDSWQQNIDLNQVTVTNMGAVILSNEADDGSLTNLVANDNSVRIVPDTGLDGVSLCPSGTTEITIGGNIKSPLSPEDSTIKIYTSDQSHNEPTPGQARQLISLLPVVHVTKAGELKVQYLDFTSTGADSGADLRITASARGAWGRLTELYLKGSVGTTIDIYMDNGDSNLGAGDRLIGSGSLLTTTTTFALNNYATFDVGGNVNEGFVRDVEQGGSPVEYYIDVTGAASTITIEGHADEDGGPAGSIDPTYDGTPYTNPPKEGTVLNVEVPLRQRLILVQLVRGAPTNSSTRLLDVKDDNIPIYFSTTLSKFNESGTNTSVELTDSSGQVERTLDPGKTSGNALVEVCFPDPTCTDEDVAIAPGKANSCAITKGLNTEVEAGSVLTIEATLYDQYGNVISNNPPPPSVTFDITSAPGLDADLDDDTNPPFNGDGDGNEIETANFGIADVSLKTSASVGDNVVKVDANGIPCGTTTVKGVLGQAGQTSCKVLGVDNLTTPLEENEIVADDCFDVLVTVSDDNGNPLPVWESIVEFSLADTTKTIQSTTLREKLFINPQKVQGKLNPNNPAQALVTVCGCDALGTLNIKCKTDTLDDGNDTLNVINSKPTCIDIEDDRENECDTDMKLHTSILDTCGNKVVDQECSEGGFASSCILLEASCGELSTEKTCVDLANTGQAPLVDLDISECGCGDILINATDTGDCCNSVYEGDLPECDFDGDGKLNESLVINKQGPIERIDMAVYPKADNQNNFWVSEKAVINLTLRDKCNQIVTCENTEVNVTLTGEDCVNDTIQVDSPIVLADGKCVGPLELECGKSQSGATTQEECEGREPVCEWEPFQTCKDFYNKPVHKVVIQNCAVPDKDGPEQNKNWTDLPEKDDIVVDKIAFSYNGPTDNVEVCVWEETEKEAGLQTSGLTKDLLWKCADLDSPVPNIPGNDTDTSENAANDTIHGSGESHDMGVGSVYLIELDDRISKWNGRNEYDNQRLGGSVIQAGDSRDYYLVLSSGGSVSCGTYDADYLYFEDYNSPDIIKWTPENKYSTHVIDTLEGSEEYTRRNDDYTGSDPYPVTTPATPSYGFGDRILHNLVFSSGQAFVYFRDLVAETVNIHVDSFFDVFFVGFPPAVADNQAKVTFLAQPATQVVALNHGDLSGDDFICDGAGFEPTILYDPDDGECGGFHSCFKQAKRTCRPAMACDGEGYDVNLRVTDGFQNPVALPNVEIQLDACLEFPHYIYLGDTLLPINETRFNKTIDLWEILKLHDKSAEPRDVCFNMAKFKSAIIQIIDEQEGFDDEFVDEHPGPDKEFLKSFVGSEEFDDFLSSIFDNKNVIFLNENGNPITQRDAAGHLIVKTNEHGKAKVRVESNDSSMFEVKSFDTSFRLFFTPHALDADYFDVAFAPGAPAQWDILAVPSIGIPADGEQEAKLLIRKLDDCGNPVAVDESAKVSVADLNLNGTQARALISRHFNNQNNYNKSVVGDLNQFTCSSLFPWFEDCSLQVLDDQIEDVVVKVEDAVCEGGTSEGFCTGPPGFGCETFHTEESCPQLEGCSWISEAICQESDSTVVSFVGAPIKLKITEIRHSDLLPADGWEEWEPGEWFDDLKFEKLPPDACGAQQIRECELNENPDICFKNCVQYGNNGGWVTVEVQDKFGNRVTGYLGDGFKKDPGDVKGKPDNIFEHICVALDDPNAFITDVTFGWLNFEKKGVQGGARIYCGDLAYGRGMFKVAYSMLSDRLTGDDGFEKQPLDPRETEKVIVSVFDKCDKNSHGNWKEKRWDDTCNAQEYNENNLPDSETASRLDPDSNKMIFVAPADRWDITSNKLVVAADGQDYATLEINTENAYMDVRTSLDATVQSSLLGSKLESTAITPGCYVKGIFDPLNPTSINVRTEDCSGGRAKLKLSSTKPGIARVTVTGNNFGCVEFEVSESDGDDIYAVPKCESFGVIPMTPKVIEIEFKQSYQNKIELKKGWNFFSVPTDLDPANDNWNELGLNTACSASASWNEATQSFQFSLGISNPIITPLEGYWCKANNDVTINVVPESTATVFLPPTKVIFPKWNDVGLSTYVEMRFEHALISIDQIYTQVLDWVESLQRYAVFANTGEAGGGTVPGTTGTGDMEAGQGYFIWSTDNDTLAGLS